MRFLRGLPLVLAFTAAGCVLTTGQFQIEFDLGDVIVTAAAVEARHIDLNGRSVYDNHKDQLKGLADVALLGKATNLGVTDIAVEAWMTTGASTFTTDAEVRAGAVKVWGPFALPAGQTTTLDWDHSSALFSTAGKTALLNEIKGDGEFTIYIIGASGTYNFAIDNGVAVFVIDAGA